MENKVRVFDDLIKIERHKPIFAGGYHDWEIQYNTLNYEKAIQIMAKAICLAEDGEGCEGKCPTGCSVYNDRMRTAEAALNALLGVKDDTK